MATSKPKTKAKPKNGRVLGRPSAYKKEYNEMGRKLCLLGYTDKQLAQFFDVAVSTLNLWKKEYPTFSESLSLGKEKADAQVAESLYKKATGFVEEVEQPMIVSDGSQTGSHIEIVRYKKYHEPHSTAAFFWLKNRQKKKWTDKQEIEHSGAVVIKDDIPNADGRE